MGSWWKAGASMHVFRNILLGLQNGVLKVLCSDLPSELGWKWHCPYVIKSSHSLIPPCHGDTVMKRDHYKGWKSVLVECWITWCGSGKEGVERNIALFALPFRLGQWSWAWEYSKWRGSAWGEGCHWGTLGLLPAQFLSVSLSYITKDWDLAWAITCFMFWNSFSLIYPHAFLLKNHLLGISCRPDTTLSIRDLAVKETDTASVFREVGNQPIGQESNTTVMYIHSQRGNSTLVWGWEANLI